MGEAEVHDVRPIECATLRRRSLALSVAVVLALASAPALPAGSREPRPSFWNKLFNRSRPQPMPAEGAGPLATLRRKLAQAKSERQAMARLGSDPADLRRMDARIDGLEQLHDLIAERQEMVRAGRPRTQIAELDQKLLAVRQGLRRIARVEPSQPGPRFDARKGHDLWSAPRGFRAEQAYEEGSLRKSMGI
jgi:hypothetical protein